MGAFFKRDWHKTQEDYFAIKDFFGKNWTKARDEFKKIKNNLGRLRTNMLNGRGFGNRVERLVHKHILEEADSVIAQIGAKKIQ